MMLIASWQRTLVLFLCIFSASQAKRAQTLDCGEKKRTKSFLWAIKRNPPAYFFGTIHVPYTRVWNHISQTAMEAFEGSDRVYFELDLTDAQTLSALSRCQMLPRGQDLRKVLPKDLYQRLKQHLNYVKKAIPEWISAEQKGKGMYADALYEAIVGNWERKKPVWVMLMINSLTKADIRTRGIPVLDLHLARKAERMGKHIGAVEKVDEQCQPLNGLNMSQVLFALNRTLMMQENLRRGELEVSYTTDDLIKQYNCGDLNAIMFDKDSVQVPSMTNGSAKYGNDDNRKNENETQNNMAADIDSYFKNELIYLRNERMARRVKALLEEFPDRTFFFAFGAGHFLGNGSVIDFLKRYGYEVENARNRRAHRNTVKLQNDHTALSNSRHKHKEKRRNRNRKFSLKRNGKGKQKRNRRHRLRGLSKSKHQKSSENAVHKLGDSHLEEEFELLDETEIRVINRYPTVFPPTFYGDWTFRQGENKDLEISLKNLWNYQTRSRKAKADSTSKIIPQEANLKHFNELQPTQQQQPYLAGGSAVLHCKYFSQTICFFSMLIIILVHFLLL